MTDTDARTTLFRKCEWIVAWDEETRSHVYLRDARALRPEWAYDDTQLSDILGRAVTTTESNV